MKRFKVLVSETAVSQIRALDKESRERIKAHLRELEKNPYMRRSGADIKKLQGSREIELYRIRIGDYRVIYTIIKEEVRITQLIHRSRGYKWLD